jgi:hypothetical protein
LNLSALRGDYKHPYTELQTDIVLSQYDLQFAALAPHQELYIGDRCDGRAEGDCQTKLRLRGHWGIENSSHWILDMVFDEDDSQVRAGNASENLAAGRKTDV